MLLRFVYVTFMWINRKKRVSSCAHFYKLNNYIVLLLICRAIYINYKKLRRDKISDRYFDENFFDEISNVTKFCDEEIFCF